MFQREINEVFEQLQLSDGLHRSSVLDSYNKLLPERSKEVKVNKIGSNDEENVQNEKVIKTAEWANTLLKELDSLMQSDKKYIAKSDDHDVRLNKNAVKYNILKPEKHVSQSIIYVILYDIVYSYIIRVHRICKFRVIFRCFECWTI